MILQAHDISKRYGATAALSHVSFSVHAGEVVGLIGANGAGKTTLMRIVSNIIDDYTGTISLSTSVGYLPEECGLYKQRKVGEQLVLFARLHGLGASAAQDSVRQWLQRLDAEQWYDKHVSQLSKGMARKVQFIAAVSHNPRLLVIDEPFSGLDPLAHKQLQDVIKELNAQGTTIIMSTHSLSDAEAMCDRLIVLKRGVVNYDGPARDIARDEILALL